MRLYIPLQPGRNFCFTQVAGNQVLQKYKFAAVF